MKMSLKWYVLILSVLLIVAPVVLFFFTALRNTQNVTFQITEKMYKDKLNGAVEILREYAKYEYGTLRLQDSQLVDKDGKPIKDRFEAVDRISKQMNVVATIFQVQGDDFLRISTSVKKDDGTRAVGTYLGKDSAAYKPVVQKQRYIGEAKILGKDYATCYDPILDERGNVIGIFFVGTPKGEIDTLVLKARNDFLQNSILLIAILAAVGSFLATLLMNSILIKPFAIISEAVEKVSQGELNYRISRNFRTKEFTNLAKDLTQMSEKLTALVKTILDSSQRVSASVEELVSTSEELSATSEELSSQMEEVNKSAQNASASIQEVTSGI
ncbi:MAG: Cache 3/Cache 2 fusion domain-containing protein, partial [Pseudothermotoga sp.]